VPLEFLRRRGGGGSAADAALTRQTSLAPLPEEAVAQEDQLRLTFAAKTSEGVRFAAGSQVLAGLPMIVAGLALSDVELVEPRPLELANAVPNITHTDEGLSWLQAHGAASPITRHALYVLESLDAIDPAFDTFACALLHGDLDTAGYPEYASIVGGVAAHWDESTGDLITRAVVGWGGRGARGGTERTAARILSQLLNAILESGPSLGRSPIGRLEPGGRSVTCPHCGYAAAHERAMFCPKCGMRLQRG
jgi:hypothetical protein